uniref:Uncharacterized protein n=1 Tax=Tanacetum cinerariifolium TaxID=118510 RepID=A0A6L2P216_TANCI|nr:hypothetical protein [Tanacetum cinerariifolium]
MLLTQLQEAWIQLSKDQLAILADTGERINFGPGAFTVTTNALFQVDEVEVYDSDCDDVPNAQPSFMANISSYGSGSLAKLHNPVNLDNNMINQGVHVKLSSEQSSVVNHFETKITSDSNIISYSQYVTQSQQIAVQNSNSSAQQDALILSKVQQLEPNLYDGNVIKNTSAIMIHDSEETLMLAEESHSKMLLKQQDPMMNFMNSLDPSPYCRPTNVEVPKKLPKVSMVNTSVKKLKQHLAGFDVVVKEITMATAITKGSDLEPLSLKLKKNREAHVDYIRITKENDDTLRDIVKQARTSNPLDNALAYACIYTKQIQELLVYVSDTCPSSPLKSEKLVVVTPMNKARKVTFGKTSTTLNNNTQIHVDVHQTQTTNKPSVPTTNVKCSTNASRSKPRSETKNNRITQPLSSNQEYQKVEAHTRNAKPSLTKENSESKYVCLTCNKCYFDARHNFCVVQHLSEVNDRARAKAVKSIKMKE